MKKITIKIKKSQLKTFGQILFNVSILTVLLKSLWYHAPEMLRYLAEPDWLTAHIVSAVFVAFTFSPAALTWDEKAKERTIFILFVLAYTAALWGLKWLAKG